jgi:hypothetical protein
MLSVCASISSTYAMSAANSANLTAALRTNPASNTNNATAPACWSTSDTSDRAGGSNSRAVTITHACQRQEDESAERQRQRLRLSIVRGHGIRITLSWR